MRDRNSLSVLFCLLSACLLISAGCRKKRGTDSSATETPAASSVGQPVESPAVPAPTTASGGLAVPAPAARINVQHFNQLTEAVLKFKRDKQRNPRDWQELISAGYLKQLPAAPPGKQYTFDRSLNVQMVPAQ